MMVKKTLAFEATGPVLVEASLEFQVQISGLKMKAEFIKIFKFEELGEAGECATLTISSKGGTSSIKLLLESLSSFSQLLHGQLPCHQLLGSVAVTVVQLQGPDVDRELLTTPSQPLGEVFVCSSSSCSRRGS